jgi:hypothetical protein
MSRNRYAARVSSTDDEVSKPPLSVVSITNALGLEVRSGGQGLGGGLNTTLVGEREGVKLEVIIKQSPHRVSPIVSEFESDGLAARFVAWYEVDVRCRATFKYGHGPAFKLLREGTFRSWLKQFGYQDIEVGKTSLDFELTIKGAQEDQIRDVLLANIDALSSYVKSREGSLPQSNGRLLRASYRMRSTSGEGGIAKLAKLVDLLVALASTDIVGMQALLDLPGAQESSDKEGNAVVMVEAPSLVAFYPARDAQRAFLQAHVALFDLAPLKPVKCTERDAIEKHFERRDLPLAKLEDAKLRVDESGLWLEWGTLVENKEVLLAGASLLSLLASPVAEGAYR